MIDKGRAVVGSIADHYIGDDEGELTAALAGVCEAAGMKCTQTYRRLLDGDYETVGDWVEGLYEVG